MKIRAGMEIRARAMRFDMDGAFVDSTAAVERVWKRAAAKWGADFETLRPHTHGRRAIDIMREILPPAALGELAAEVAAIDQAEFTETEGIMAIGRFVLPQDLSAAPANRARPERR